ncbi:MAG: hypothetical protein IH591_07335 [Bacteroidales bacterium]|nr:hypothetical protein [Bacteroidales bacterium]
MLPRKMSESELMDAFELILKYPEYIYDLDIPEAKELLALAKKESREIVKLAVKQGRDTSINIGAAIEEKYHLEIQPNIPKHASVGKLYTAMDILEARIKVNPPQHKTKPIKRIVPNFPDWIINSPIDEKKFCHLLKNEFNSEMGLGIRYMIEGLKDLNYLTWGDRERQKLFDSLNDYFGRYLGTYNSIFREKNIDVQNKVSAIARIKSVVKSLE